MTFDVLAMRAERRLGGDILPAKSAVYIIDEYTEAQR